MANVELDTSELEAPVTRPQRVIILAYREWALRAARMISGAESRANEAWSFEIITTEREAENVVGFAPAVIIALGWSWTIRNSLRDRCTGPTLIAHPSPLPRYRGGSPIQAQIIAGEETSALTLFEATDVMDQGPIFWQQAFSLKGTLPCILDRISDLSVDAVRAALLAIRQQTYTTMPQPKGDWGWNTRRTPESSKIGDVDMTGRELVNLLRVLMLPYPPAYLETSDHVRIPIKIEQNMDAAMKAYAGEQL